MLIYKLNLMEVDCYSIYIFLPLTSETDKKGNNNFFSVSYNYWNLCSIADIMNSVCNQTMEDFNLPVRFRHGFFRGRTQIKKNFFVSQIVYLKYIIFYTHFFIYRAPSLSRSLTLTHTHTQTNLHQVIDPPLT